jgi:type IV secretory pathway component VirB8
MSPEGFWRTVRDAIQSNPRTARLLVIIISVAVAIAILAAAGIHMTLPLE